MDWELVRREAPEVVGADPGDSARLQVRVPLSVPPPGEWASYFAAPPRVRLDPGIRAPVIDGASVWMSAPDAQLPAYMRQVDTRIAVANERYIDEVAPRIRVQQPRDLDAVGREERRLADARRQGATL